MSGILKNNFLDVRLLFLLFATLLIVFREVDLFLNPRFWAEEGRVYFLAAYSDGFKAIFYSHQGYFSLTPNVATYLSTFLPLKLAPIPTLFFSFLVTLLPSIIIIYSKSDYLNSNIAKLFAILIVYFVSNTEEVWLNTINSQFWFVVIAFLILIENKENVSKLRLNSYAILIFISGLSGAPANIMAPFFLIKYYFEKSSFDLKLFYIFISTILIQMVYILGISDYGGARFIYDGEKIIAATKTAVSGVVYYPFAFNADVSPKFAMIFSLIIVGLLIKKENFIKAAMLLTIPFFVSLIMTFTSLGMNGGGRYFFPVAVIYVMSIFYLIRTNETSLNVRVVVYVFLISAIALGLQRYTFKPGFTTHSTWHKWADEVERFQNREQDFISLYPQWKNAYWSVELPRK